MGGTLFVRPDTCYAVILVHDLTGRGPLRTLGMATRGRTPCVDPSTPGAMTAVSGSAPVPSSSSSRPGSRGPRLGKPCPL